MPTFIGIGHSKTPDPVIAAKEAAMMAKSQINTAQCNLIIIFATMGYQNPEIFRVIQPILQPHYMIGSSTSGIILSETILAKGIAIMAIFSDEIEFNSVLETEFEGDDIKTVGNRFGQQLINKSPGSTRHGLLYFADPYYKNQSSLINGIQSNIGISFPFLGAVSSDAFTYTHAFQVHHQVFAKKAVSGSFICGQATVATDLKHGWNPLGKPRKVTASSGNVIHTIDNKPAIDIYYEFFGESAKNIEKEK